MITPDHQHQRPRRPWGRDSAVIMLAFDEMRERPVTDGIRTALRIPNERLHGPRILAVCFGGQQRLPPTPSTIHQQMASESPWAILG